MMGEKVIVMKKVTKVYENEVVALDDVSFDVERGEILGYLGPNGAGKTTTVNILTTSINPTSGVARVCGYDTVARATEVRKKIGVAAQDITLDWMLTVYDNMEIYSMLYRVPKHDRKSKIASLLEDFQLSSKLNERTVQLSGGEQRRLQIARALLSHPEVMFIDEPTLGLDPVGKKMAWDYLKRLSSDGATVFLATNDMMEAENLCSRIIFLNKGRIICEGTPTHLKKEFASFDLLELDCEDDKRVMSILERIDEVKNVRKSGHGFKIVADHADELAPELISLLNSRGIRVHRVSIRQPTLDDVFMKIVEGGRRQ